MGPEDDAGGYEKDWSLVGPEPGEAKDFEEQRRQELVRRRHARRVQRREEARRRRLRAAGFLTALVFLGVGVYSLTHLQQRVAGVEQGNGHPDVVVPTPTPSATPAGAAPSPSAVVRLLGSQSDFQPCSSGTNLVTTVSLQVEPPAGFVGQRAVLTVTGAGAGDYAAQVAGDGTFSVVVQSGCARQHQSEIYTKVTIGKAVFDLRRHP